MLDSCFYCLFLSGQSLFYFYLSSLWKFNYYCLFYLPGSSASFLFPDFFFLFSISSPLFLRRPDFSFHVDNQPGSSLSLLEFQFLDCCQLSTLLLIAGVVLSSFHSVFPLPSVTFCFSSLYSFLFVSFLKAL